jgi:hypothetical protein
VLPSPLNIPPPVWGWVWGACGFGCCVGIGFVLVKLLLGGGELDLDPPLDPPPLGIFLLYVMKLK